MSQNLRLAITVITVFGLFFCGSPVIAASDSSTKGKVTLNGKPLVAGKVTLHLENGQFVGSKVKDGNFVIDKMQTGRFRVTIEGKDVPAKYSSDEATPLVCVVKEGENLFEFIID